MGIRSGEYPQIVFINNVNSKNMKKLLLTYLLLSTTLLTYAQSSTEFEGYLFAYFEGKGADTEQIRFAVSADAMNWSALNENRPIMASSAISQTGGVRDPHILRGAGDGAFYMVATDMFTKKNGWDSNPGMVLMKSNNLTDWSHTVIDIAKLYPRRFGKVKWVWAPQTIYDAKEGKYMVYFTIRFHGSEKLDIYYAYANCDFTGFEREPQLLFSPKYGGIDAAIIERDGVFHLFFKGNTKDKDGKEIKNGIQRATSRLLRGTWIEDFEYHDAYANDPTKVEGSSVFKLNGKEEYILMYDVYSAGRYEFQRSSDLQSFSQTPESFTKNFNPRHGSVIGITRTEAQDLSRKWSGVPATMLRPRSRDERYNFQSHGNPIIKHRHSADPATLVYNDTLWVFVGEDAAPNQKGYVMHNWGVYSTTDMKNWIEYPIPLNGADFAWSSKNAFAAHVVERDGKFYFYVSTNSTGIGVAVADRPEGPYKDVLGKPLLTNKDCFDSSHSWACIDPAVFIDDDGQAWIFWGNRECYYAKLKRNMIEIDGEVKRIEFDGLSFTEAPWIHKYNNKYYFTYATEFPEKIAYAMADNIEGPYEYKGLLSEVAGNSNTIHQAICEFKGQWYFVYHNGGINTG